VRKRGFHKDLPRQAAACRAGRFPLGKRWTSPAGVRPLLARAATSVSCPLLTTADVAELVVAPPVFGGPDAAYDIMEAFSELTSRILRTIPLQREVRAALQNVRLSDGLKTRLCRGRGTHTSGATLPGPWLTTEPIRRQQKRQKRGRPPQLSIGLYRRINLREAALKKKRARAFAKQLAAEFGMSRSAMLSLLHRLHHDRSLRAL
jgi:hypothetical protein